MTAERPDTARPFRLGISYRSLESGIAIGASAAFEGDLPAGALPLGFRAFDLGEDPADEEHLAQLRRAADRLDGTVTVAVAAERWDWLSRGSGPDGGRKVRLVPTVRLADFLRRDPAPAAPTAEPWALHLPSPQLPDEALDRAAREGAAMVLAPTTLLEFAAVERLAERLEAAEIELWGTDPFAAGRFDGSLLDAGAPFGGPPDRSRGVQLRGQLAPVLRFDFLALPRQRSLPQAVLRLLAEVRGLDTVLLPARRPEALRGLANFSDVPPVDDVARARVRELSDGAT